MARNLHKAGYLKMVWNRTTAMAQQLADELAVPVATDPAALAAQCDLVVLSVSADADLLEVMQVLLPGLHTGCVVLDSSTVSRETAIQAAALARPAGAAFLDAPV